MYNEWLWDNYLDTVKIKKPSTDKELINILEEIETKNIETSKIAKTWKLFGKEKRNKQPKTTTKQTANGSTNKKSMRVPNGVINGRLASYIS